MSTDSIDISDYMLPTPRQQGIFTPMLESILPAVASDADLEQLCNTIDKLKLQRLMQRKQALGIRLDDLFVSTSNLQHEYECVCGKIDAMQDRGVSI